jgi:ABC-type nitrate/sulfonate/bicarbonate transport system permease component
LFITLLFEIWFGDSVWGEVIFILILVMGNLKSSFFKEMQNVNSEYLNSAKSLGLSEDVIILKVAWKVIQPKIFNSIAKEHLSIWTWVLIYEFICQTDGVGQILYLALKYNDISLLIVLFVIVIIIWLIMEIAFQNIKKKFFFWE